MINDLGLLDCSEVLNQNYLGRLAYISGKHPYVLPITYFHDTEEKCIISYSSEGHKIQAMRKCEWVSLQVDDIESIQRWRSVQVHGRFEELEGSTAKKYLQKFAEGVQNTISKLNGEKPKFIQDFSNRLQHQKIPIVYRIVIKDIVGKIRHS